MANVESQNPDVEELVETTDGTDTSNPAKVILFNDDWHTFDDVITQLIKAINCSTKHAEGIAWTVHTKGKAIVYSGDMDKCLKVSSILEEIALITQIEF